jgi:hypothetical protein
MNRLSDIAYDELHFNASVWGSEVHTNESEFYVTELDILNILKDYEFTIEEMREEVEAVLRVNTPEKYPFYVIEQWIATLPAEEVENVFLEYCVREDFEGVTDNTYNINSDVVINYEEFQMYGRDEVYVRCRFHRYGDVRGNYTEWIYLEMNIDEFMEILYSQHKIVEVPITYNDEEYVITVFTNCIGEYYDINCEELGLNESVVKFDVEHAIENTDDLIEMIEYFI